MTPRPIALRQTCLIGCPVPASVRHYIFPQPASPNRDSKITSGIEAVAGGKVTP